MKRRIAISIVLAIAVACMCAFVAGCGSGGDEQTELKDMREVRWEDTVLTINVGTNKSTGCEWDVEIGDDSVIGYGLHRVFHLSDDAAKDGQAAGYSEITFEGKGAGQTSITLTTPKDWDGNEPGYTYKVLVLVNDDGTIAHAEPTGQ